MTRLAVIAMSICLAACGPHATKATSKPAVLPKIALNTPYSDARKQLIAKGFIPQRVVSRSPYVGEPPKEAGWCPADAPDPAAVCREYPELMACSMGMHIRCAFLYRHETSGRFAEVTTRCMEFGKSYCFEAISWDPYFIDDYPSDGSALTPR